MNVAIAIVLTLSALLHHVCYKACKEEGLTYGWVASAVMFAACLWAATYLWALMVLS